MVKKGKSKVTAAESIKQQSIKSEKPVGSGFAFGRENFRLLFIGLGLLLLGFLLMIGGGSDDPNVFNYKIFDFQRLTLAPLLILAGYVVQIFAIMKKPKD
jgi:hypothetical protein